MFEEILTIFIFYNLSDWCGLNKTTITYFVLLYLFITSFLSSYNVAHVSLTSCVPPCFSQPSLPSRPTYSQSLYTTLRHPSHCDQSNIYTSWSQCVDVKKNLLYLYFSSKSLNFIRKVFSNTGLEDQFPYIPIWQGLTLLCRSLIRFSQNGIFYLYAPYGLWFLYLIYNL